MVRVRFHDLRHTLASLMLLAGEHPKIVSEALGQSSVASTLDTYSHLVAKLQEAGMRRLDDVMPPLGEKTLGILPPNCRQGDFV